MLDLENTVDFFERKSGGLDVEEPDDRDPAEVQHGEDDVEAPFDGFDACGEEVLISRVDVEGLWRQLLDLPMGVIETMM